MRYFMDWRDYTNQPHIKKLIESKGIETVRQQYVRESNKAMWDDPFVLNEHHAPGLSLPNNNSAAASSSPSIIGNTAEVSRFTWASGITNDITGSHPLSASIHGYYFDIAAYDGSVDYSYSHVSSTKTFRCYITSASNFAPTVPNSISGVITASYGFSTETTNITGSIVSKWKEAFVNQGASAVVAGFTNTIAPSTLFTATIAAGSGSLTLTHVNEGGVPDITTNLVTATASVSVVTQGNDKFYNETGYYTGAVLFDGAVEPYTTLARKG
jgi:hypothetical protein